MVRSLGPSFFIFQYIGAINNSTILGRMHKMFRLKRRYSDNSAFLTISSEHTKVNFDHKLAGPNYLIQTKPTLMNWKSIFFLLLACFVAAPMVQAQEMSKEEKKKWKELARNYRKDLNALKILVEEHDGFRDQVSQAQAEASQLRAAMDSKDRQISSYQQQVADLNNQILAMESAPPPPPVTDASDPIMSDEAMINGIVYRVQIGAFAKTKLSEDMETAEAFKLENTGDDIQRVIVGQFRQFSNAKLLRDRMRQMGVSDAFIVAYQDGNRIDVQEAIKITGEG